MPTMEIASVWFGDGKMGNLSFKEKPDVKIKVWANAPFRDALKVGAVAEAKFETMPAKGDFPEQKVLKSWDGVAMPERGGFKPGGGGGGRLSPEDFRLEKRSILASVALKEAREMKGGTGVPETLEVADVFYGWLTKKVGI